jgi:hypothetical protein
VQQCIGATRRSVSKAGAWAGTVEQIEGGDRGETASWTISVLIRNVSELPVRVNTVDLDVRPWGYDRVLAVPSAPPRSITT